MAAATVSKDDQPTSQLKCCEKDVRTNLPNFLGPVEFADGIIDNESIYRINIQEKLKCIILAIDEAVKGTNVSNIWNETKKQLEFVLIRMKACRREQTITDEIM